MEELQQTPIYLRKNYRHTAERIRFLEEELNNTIEASTEEKEELKEEISKLKRIVRQLEEENKKKDKEISNKNELITEFDEHRLELINTREALQNAQAWNLNENENESDFDENSPDLYNSDNNMATITELANAIDRFLNDRTTTRETIVDRIKRATREICRKETNMQRGLTRDQQRRFDAEGDRDIEILHSQTLEEEIQQLRTNAQNQVNRMISNIARKQTRISELLGEKLALQLIYRRCKAEADLSEFNHAWVFNRYQKWKAREINSCQNILNLKSTNFGAT
ncbi:hypothetical protein C2G38_2176293 [Gigaspora rosea]|uniref:Uncharacterized protein n=1 Tax=Gigaspora rosea TaxID=44941 RepID=A0A397VJQ0_9GLOM|nr:hypothetical protein C2G38_2176293 [Gigaspora rosea]